MAAACPRCGGSKKLNKRTDGWYHCRRHGKVRKVNTPFYLIKQEKREMQMKYLNEQKIAQMETAKVEDAA